MVTQDQLKKHLDEAARKQGISMMGGDPTGLATPLRIQPITGNNIFPSPSPTPTPTPAPESAPTGGDNTLVPEGSISLPPPTTLPLHSIPQHFIDDNDFQPDTTEHIHDPPQVPESYEYPSMEMSDEDDSEAKDQDDSRRNEDSIRDAPDLEEIDWEYLRQRTFILCMGFIALVLRFWMTAGNLTQYELAICRTFAFLVRTQLTGEQFSMIPDMWPEISDFHSEHVLCAKVSGLAGIEPQRFDCCVGSCVCFTGHCASLDKCPRCNEPRF